MTASAPAQSLQEAVEAARVRGQQVGRGMTVQTRMCVAAMRHIGVPRSEFSASTSVDRKTGEYGSATVSPRSPEAYAKVIEHRFDLADAGFHVHITDSTGSAFFGCGHGIEPGVFHFTGQKIETETRP